MIISVAIHLHAPLTCLALSKGSHVLCEKPLCASIEDIKKMAEAERQAGKFVAIGYQWSYTSAVQALKQDILNGVLGRPKRMKTIVLWPRTASYYRRNAWADRIKTDEGEWVVDSPAHNATAHDLHNILYLLGETIESSAWPLQLQAECYRANPTENYDAIALRCHTESGVEVLFYSAHSVPETIGPLLHYEFENAVVGYRPGPGESFVAISVMGILALTEMGQLRKYFNVFVNNVHIRDLQGMEPPLTEEDKVILMASAAGG